MARSTDQIPREEKGKMIVEDNKDSWDEGYDSTDSDTSFHHGESETIKPSHEDQPLEPFIKVCGIRTYRLCIDRMVGYIDIL